MTRVTPLATAFEVDDSTLSPGTIFRKLDGSLWKVNPNGSQSPLTSGGGGAWGEASTAEFSGSGSPVGVVTPSGEGDLYVDDTTPALWQATGATDTDWALVGGGGSQPDVVVVRVPLNFDTPDLVLTGIEIDYTPAAGDIIGQYMGGIYGATAWDGSTPTLHVGSPGALTAYDAAFTSSLPLSGGPGPIDAHAQTPWIGGLPSNTGIELLDDTPITVMVDDGSGSDPGSMVGAAVLVLAILKAPA